MTRIADAVIGAGYGDEGKGLLTDALAGPDHVVVRTNGGAQAGHTVETPEGLRHVFRHVAAGSFRGARTHLSRFFVSHPIVLAQELAELRAIGIAPRITVDPRSPVTTPFDMLVNQIVEIHRGGGRHGSCGLGFGETIERTLRPELAITVADLADGDLRERLAAIRDAWLPVRLAALGVDCPDPRLLDVALRPEILGGWLQDVAGFLGAVEIVPDEVSVRDAPVVLEGAQGLMLDQDEGAFPFVTRSNTGLRNMVAFAREAGIRRIRATYATRCYRTRHGAGPLAGERVLEGFRVVDPTNEPNDWQGAIRHAPLDVDEILRFVRRDLSHAASDVAVEARLAITCLDQAPDLVPIVLDGAERWIRHEDLADLLRMGHGETIVSHGPTRSAVAVDERRRAA